MGKYVFAYKGGGMAETEEEQKRDGGVERLVRRASATRSSTSGNPFGASTARRRQRHVGADRLLDHLRRQPRRGASKPRRAARSSRTAAASRSTRRSSM